MSLTDCIRAWAGWLCHSRYSAAFHRAEPRVAFDGFFHGSDRSNSAIKRSYGPVPPLRAAVASRPGVARLFRAAGYEGPARAHAIPAWAALIPRRIRPFRSWAARHPRRVPHLPRRVGLFPARVSLSPGREKERFSSTQSNGWPRPSRKTEVSSSPRAGLLNSGAG